MLEDHKNMFPKVLSWLCQILIVFRIAPLKRGPMFKFTPPVQFCPNIFERLIHGADKLH